MNSMVCRAAADHQQQQRAVLRATQALDRTFTVYGEELENVHSFKYLGRILSTTDNDCLALTWNLAKSRKQWARVSTVLAREGAKPKVSAMFYKAVVQSVLLYGAETWVFSQAMFKQLEGFHHQAVRRLACRTPYRQNGGWVYPPIEEALEKTGVYPLHTYMLRRRRYTFGYVQHRPVLLQGKRELLLPGTPINTKYWCEDLI